MGYSSFKYCPLPGENLCLYIWIQKCYRHRIILSLVCFHKWHVICVGHHQLYICSQLIYLARFSIKLYRMSFRWDSFRFPSKNCLLLPNSQNAWIISRRMPQTSLQSMACTVITQSTQKMLNFFLNSPEKYCMTHVGTCLKNIQLI